MVSYQDQGTAMKAMGTAIDRDGIMVRARTTAAASMAADGDDGTYVVRHGAACKICPVQHYVDPTVYPQRIWNPNHLRGAISRVRYITSNDDCGHPPSPTGGILACKWGPGYSLTTIHDHVRGQESAAPTRSGPQRNQALSQLTRPPQPGDHPVMSVAVRVVVLLHLLQSGEFIYIRPPARAWGCP
jgi:hypothetical protein